MKLLPGNIAPENEWRKKQCCQFSEKHKKTAISGVGKSGRGEREGTLCMGSTYASQITCVDDVDHEDRSIVGGQEDAPTFHPDGWRPFYVSRRGGRTSQRVWTDEASDGLV